MYMTFKLKDNLKITDGISYANNQWFFVYLFFKQRTK